MYTDIFIDVQLLYMNLKILILGGYNKNSGHYEISTDENGFEVSGNQVTNW